MRKRITVAPRTKVFSIAGGICEYCQTDSEFSDSPFEVEHIIPVVKRGSSNPENLALACHGSNLRKSIKTEGYDVITDAIVALFHPRRNEWNDHFMWSEDRTLIVGLTPVGRATVDMLDLNRKGLVNQRRLLGLLDIAPVR